ARPRAARRDDRPLAARSWLVRSAGEGTRGGTAEHRRIPPSRRAGLGLALVGLQGGRRAPRAHRGAEGAQEYDRPRVAVRGAARARGARARDLVAPEPGLAL